MKLDLSGIWSFAFISLFMHLLMGSVSYALSANMYSGLYFFTALIEAIANLVSCLGPFTACEYSIIFVSTSIAICDLVKCFRSFPLVAKCCEAAGIKYISWSYDAPLNVPDIEKTLGFKCNKVYLYDRLMVQEYNDKGFDNVHHLPLSVNVDRLDKIKITDNDIKKYSADISFVGQLYQSQMPLIMSAIDEYHRGFLEAVMKAQSKIYGYFLIDDVLKPEFMDKLNEIAAFPISKEALSYAMSAQVTRDERLLFLKLLSNHYDVKLYSSENNELLSNATFMGTVGYMNEMPKVFKLSKINLNMSLRCIKSGIPLRALDIMGAGGFLMSNYQPELAEYFIDGEDYVMYESIEDMYAKVDFYLKNDELRQTIAENGHAKVKELFDYDSRIEAMLSEGV